MTREQEQKDTLPWIEKYRPKTLDQVISHKIIVNAINKFIDSGNLPHMLLHGPPGTGKTSTILACARQIYGSDYGTMVMEINASEERGIEVVRNRIIPFASTKGFAASTGSSGTTFKLVVLDEADAMTADAQKSLRTVIEQYTYNVRFCLICNYIKKINPAIQSRCVCFKFSPLQDKMISKRIKEISASENVSISESGIDALIKRSKGDMRKVLNIMQSVCTSYADVTDTVINNCIGYPLDEDLNIIYNSLNEDNIKKCFDTIKKIKDREGYSLIDIMNEIHNRIVKSLLEDNFNANKCCNILKRLGEIEYNLVSTIDESLQLGAFISAYKLGYTE